MTLELLKDHIDQNSKLVVVVNNRVKGKNLKQAKSKAKPK